MEESFTYRHAQPDDLVGIATIFIAAFPASIRHYVGHPLKPNLVADLFAICLDAEPDSFFVALTGTRVAGYVFAPAHFSRLPGIAIRHGHLCRLAWRWLTGQYGIGLRPVVMAARNWLALLRESHNPALASDARILSIAVHPDYQRHGIGSTLLTRALAELTARGIDTVRLEVRPENTAAIHVYEKYGFFIVGKTRDTQGDWLVMLNTRPASE